MKCPVCNSQDSRVLDSRPIDDGASIKRRRECPSCGKRFTTYEVVDTVPIAVVKRDGRREFFDKHKLVLGIENSIITEISAKDIGEMVLRRLKEIDIVSYIRFASVYREFKDVDSFMNEISGLLEKEKGGKKK